MLRFAFGHPTYGSKCSTSEEDTWDSSWGWFWILMVTSEIGVLEKAESAVLSCITQMTKLSVVIRVMNVGYQPTWTSVTSSRPFSVCVSKLVYGPTFQDCLVTYIGHFSNNFWLLLLEVVIIQARRWNCVQLFCLFCFPMHNTSLRPFFACPSMSHTRIFFLRKVRFLPSWKFFSCRSQKFVIRTFLYWLSMLSFEIHTRWVHPKYTWPRNYVGSPRSTSSINFFVIWAKFCFLPSHSHIIDVYR